MGYIMRRKSEYTICTSECEKCMNYCETKNKNKFYCKAKDKIYFFGQYIPCDLFNKEIEDK